MQGKTITTTGPTRLLAAAAVAEQEGISRTTLWRLIKAGRHPRPVHVGHLARFSSHEVDEYVADLLATRGARKGQE
ncbi:MAG TPA: AlpA family phage regulatory protein [Rhodanobacteraceae bacterium]